MGVCSAVSPAGQPSPRPGGRSAHRLPLPPAAAVVVLSQPKRCRVCGFDRVDHLSLVPSGRCACAGARVCVCCCCVVCTCSSLFNSTHTKSWMPSSIGAVVQPHIDLRKKTHGPAMSPSNLFQPSARFPRTHSTAWGLWPQVDFEGYPSTTGPNGTVIPAFNCSAGSLPRNAPRNALLALPPPFLPKTDAFAWWCGCRHRRQAGRLPPQAGRAAARAGASQRRVVALRYVVIPTSNMLSHCSCSTYGLSSNEMALITSNCG